MLLKTNKIPYLITLLVAIVLFSFWIFSRYPALLSESQKVVNKNFIDRNIGGFSKNEIQGSVPNQSNIEQIFVNFINWCYENIEGMIFSLLFASLLLTASKFLVIQYGFLEKGGILGGIMGALVGVFLGLCTNCVAPIGFSLKKAGPSDEFIQGLSISSPTLNIVGLYMLFLLFPFDIAFIRFFSILLVVCIFIPTIFNKKNDHNRLVEKSLIKKNKNIQLNIFVKRFFFHWFESIKTIFIKIVPTMIIVAFVIAILTTYVPVESVATLNQHKTMTIILSALVGIILPVPMFFDLLIVSYFYSLGVSPSICIALLIVLPTTSIFSFLILSKVIAWRKNLALIFVIFSISIMSSLLYRYIVEVENNKNLITNPKKFELIGYNSIENPHKKISFSKLNLKKVSNEFKDNLYFSYSLDFSRSMALGSGLAWSDWNNDGWQDLLAILEGKPYLFINQKGNLKLLENIWPYNITNVIGANFVDFDGDGDLDVFFTRYGDFSNGKRFNPLPLQNVLLENQNNKFKDITERANLKEKKFSQGSAWADMDADGDLDLYVANYGHLVKTGAEKLQDQTKFSIRDASEGNTKDNFTKIFKDVEWTFTLNKDDLYKNNGDGTFTNVSNESNILGIDQKVTAYWKDAAEMPLFAKKSIQDKFVGHSFQPAWIDYDNDGDLDIIVVNDFYHNLLYINDGLGNFDNIKILGGGKSNNIMGITVADINDDGYFDYIENGWTKKSIWINDEGDNFSNKDSNYDLTDPMRIGWGVVIDDFNNDNKNEILMANSAFSYFNIANKRRYYKYKIASQNSFYSLADGKYQNNALKLEIAESNLTRGLATADYNNDGLIDYASINLDEGICLYKNESQGGRFLFVEPIGNGKNKFAIGAKISIQVDKKWRHKRISLGDSYASQSSSILHFGVGDKTKVDRIKVQWSNTEISFLDDIPTNHKITIYQDQ